MLFSSATFLFLFLPITLGLYYLLPQKFRNAFLLLASLIFYAFGEQRYLLIMFIIILINYWGALLISQDEKKAKILLFFTISANIGTLFYFKYFNFILGNLNEAFNTGFSLWDIALPLGISFYTFQATSYTVDVYRKIVQPQKNIYQLALYICLFPQLIAGPIVKYRDMVEQIKCRHTSFNEFYYGLRRFIIGLAKKVIIADTLGVVANKIFELSPYEYGTIAAWFGAVIYALQFYYDFSSYADMAIGLGHLFGFKIMENFNYPYISKSMTETWRRWHISLGMWFKDYLYIPLGGSRKGEFRKNINLMLIFFFMGTWHGATWMFVISGIYNGLLIVFENITKLYQEKSGILYNLLKRFYTIIAIILGVFWFRVKSVSYAWDFILNLFGFLDTKDAAFNLLLYINRFELIIIFIAAVCSVPIFKNMLFWGEKNKFAGVLIDFWLFIVLVFSCMQIAASTYNPFIYFRF